MLAIRGIYSGIEFMEQLGTSPVPMRDARWQGGLELIAEMRRQPGITRAEAARRRGLSSGSATDIVTRLRRLALVDEAPAPSGARGRPTNVLLPHPIGPVVLAIDVRQNGWQSAYAAIDGEPETLQSGQVAGRQPERVVASLRKAVEQAKRRFGVRLRAVSVAVAGAVEKGRIVQSTTLGWEAIGLATIATGLPLLVGNDARLAGVAEARRGAASGARVCLHLSLLVGVGGALVVDGVPVTGASGMGGEFGHLPFSDPSLRCQCGARGCWDLEIDGLALARLLGAPVPADPYYYATGVIAAARGDAKAQSAVDQVSSALGRGVAGLVNALDPEVVTLGGLGPPLLAAATQAFEGSYGAGLMSFRRASAPPVVAATFREDGPLRGGVELALDSVLCEAGLTSWSASQGLAPGGETRPGV